MRECSKSYSVITITGYGSISGEHSTIPFILKLEVVFSSSDEDWEEQL